MSPNAIQVFVSIGVTWPRASQPSTIALEAITPRYAQAGADSPRVDGSAPERRSVEEMLAVTERFLAATFARASLGSPDRGIHGSTGTVETFRACYPAETMLAEARVAGAVEPQVSNVFRPAAVPSTQSA